jgi:multidrug efflux pump subunit AcrA (membrane-fusion protein)
MAHNFSSRPRGPKRLAVALPALALVLALGGCASVPPPTDAMNQARLQLQSAREAGAGDYAPVDLDFAQNRYQMAQAAMARRDYEAAASLADEARADAELARAKARLGAARAQIQAKTAENARLRAQAEAPLPAEDDSAPAPAASGQAPAQDGLPPTDAPADMPAPPSSILAPPPASSTDQGFQSQPSQNQGGQP